MKILILNTWSSSLKYQLFEMPSNIVLAKWLVDKIWIEWSSLIHRIWETKIIINNNFLNHKEAINWVLEILSNWENAVIDNLSELDAIGHRIVHWWEYFTEPVMVTEDVINKIEICEKLAPLHNPASKAWIIACLELIPAIKQVTVFDTAFHQTMHKEAYLYALPYEYYEKYKIRRYWFHGTSHDYVSSRAAELVWANIKDLKIISCHVGNWASIAAINWWKVIDTSMWFTPLEWLIMWTRSWDIDPAIVTFLMKNENLSPVDMDIILNKKSWVLWISNLTWDMRDIEDWFIAWKQTEVMVMNMYVNRIVKYIWSYIAELNWVDLIVLTAWVLENSPIIRQLIIEKLSWFWINLEYNTNNSRWKEVIISSNDSKIKVIVVPTNEEFMIANHTYKLCN